MDEFTSQYVYTEFIDLYLDQRWSVPAIHFQSSWVYSFGRSSRSGSRNSHGRAEKTRWKGLFLFGGCTYSTASAESLTAATGRKFTAVVLDAETFLNETTQPGSMFEPAYSKGGFEFFRYVEDGRMAYVGTVRDDTKRILGREPLLLTEWAKIHANELLEIAGS